MPMLAYQGALIAKLKADPGVAALLTAPGGFVKIYDIPPRDALGAPDTANAPFVATGPFQNTRFEVGAEEAWTLRLRLYAISVQPGNAEVMQIASAVKRAIDNQSLTLAGWVNPISRVLSMGSVVNPLQPRQVWIDIEAALYSTTPFPF